MFQQAAKLDHGEAAAVKGRQRGPFAPAGVKERREKRADQPAAAAADSFGVAPKRARRHLAGELKNKQTSTQTNK